MDASSYSTSYSTKYEERRSELETYFDQTAVDAWKRLTSDAPVSRIRQTVRAGRDEMRNTLLDWLPRDLSGRRILDAGCGTGALAVEAAKRGAQVVATDLSPTLVELARERVPEELQGLIDFRAGDMTAPELGSFDHVVAMDSLIHYDAPDVLNILGGLADRVTRSILFTFAPRTPLLGAMHTVGKLFPRSDRAPAIQPIVPLELRQSINNALMLAGWKVGRERRVSSGFYISQALEIETR